MKITVKNLEKKEYKGEKSYYAEIEGRKTKLKNFNDNDLSNGKELEGDLKETEYNGKTYWLFWKATPKPLKQEAKSEMLEQIYAKIFEQDKINTKILEQLQELSDKFDAMNELKEKFNINDNPFA